MSEAPRDPPEWLIFFNLLNREELRRQVEEKRTQLGYRWADLAEKAGISTPYLHQLLNGKKSNPSQKTSEAIRRLTQILNIQLDGLSSPAGSPPTPAEAPVLIRKQLAALTEPERVALVRDRAQGRFAWVVDQLLRVGYARDFVEQELQITRQTLDHILAGGTTVLPRQVERLCALTGLGDDFVFKGILEVEITALWQELHGMLEDLRSQGVPADLIRAALSSLVPA